MNAEGTRTCPRCGHAELSELGVCLVCAMSSLARESQPPPEAPLIEDRRTFQGYEILSEIGRGGMGVVFEAWQPALKRTVAIKVILAGDLASDETRLRFAREAEALAKNRHPGIVPIYDFGQSEGRCFFVMQLIRGQSLANRLKTGDPRIPFSAPEAASLVAKLARALHGVHENGIVHLDVSPENILLDQDGEPWITDFGLACFLAESPQTRTYIVVGKPDYLSPELATAKRSEISPRCDVFSLGVVFYELLCGRRPFAAESALATLDRVRSENPTALSRGSQKVDRNLETICLKCLEKAPAHRYPNAKSLAEDLERWMRGEPILARPAPWTEQVWKWAARHPQKAALTAALVLLALVPAGIVAYFYAIVVPETARTHPTVGRDHNLNGFAMNLETGRLDRASMNFDTVSFRSRDRAAVLYFTNIPPDAVEWIASLRCQVMADIIGLPDEPRGPVVRQGDVFTIARRLRRDRAFYIAPSGWQGQDVLARAPNAHLCVTLLDEEPPWPDRR